jgi:hypothetical protein
MRTHANHHDGLNQINLLAPARALATLWILISPWVLFVTGVALPNVPAAISHFLAGMVIMVFPMAAGTSPKTSEAWVSLAGGVCLVISPWLLGYGNNSWGLALNSIVSGVVIIGLAGWEIGSHRHPRPPVNSIS